MYADVLQVSKEIIAKLADVRRNVRLVRELAETAHANKTTRASANPAGLENYATRTNPGLRCYNKFIALSFC